MANRRPSRSTTPRGRQPNLPKRTTENQRRASRAQREAKRSRQLYIGTAIAAGAVVLVLLVGFLTEFVIRPRQVLASVNDTNITRQVYWRARGVELVQQIDQYQLLAGLVPAEQAGQYRQAAIASQTELDSLWGSTDVNDQFLQSMVEDQVYLQYSDDLGIEVSDDELDEFVLNQFAPEDAPLIQPTVTPTLIPTRAAWATETAMASATVAGQVPGDTAGTVPVTEASAGTPAIGTPQTEATPLALSGTPELGGTPTSGTPSAGTPVVSPTPEPAEARQTAEAGFTQFRNRTFETARIDEGDYREWVARPSLVRQKIDDHLVAELGQTAPQVQGAHILVSTEDLANQLRGEVEAGADLAALARTQSIDTATAPNGGDLGWYSQYDVEPEFWDATAELQAGDLSQPFQTQYGWHIVRVAERADDRPLTEEQLTQAREQVADDWLTARIAEADVDSDELEPTPTPGAAQFVPPVNAPPTPTISPATPAIGTPITGTPGVTPIAAIPGGGTPVPQATPIGDRITVEPTGTVPPPTPASVPSSSESTPDPTATESANSTAPAALPEPPGA